MGVHKTGRVYWITGLKSSGKTTIGTALYYALKENNDNVLILDGDILKQFVGDAFGYTAEDRLARGKRYAKLCKLLVEQGIIVVICTISMFDEIRAWNRKNIKGYIEVFVDTPLAVIMKRDKSKIYSRDEMEASFKNAQFPKNPDAILSNDGTEDIARMVQRIIKLQPKTEDDFARDQLYWNEYYGKKQESLRNPSNFAQSISKEMIPGKQLLELGCGNGRDSLFFINQGLYVTGVDASDEAIRKLQSNEKNVGRGIFVCDDFVKCRAVFQRQYDYVYSRFTLHSITDDQEDELLRNIKEAMVEGSKLFIEARTIHDDIYGKGEKVSRNAYVYEDHFRRFIDPDVLKKKMESIGYKILELQEKKGFSKTADSDPVLLRLVATISTD